MTAALQMSAVVCRFGDFTAVDRLSLSIEPGARHALIGPNGAGKTSLINLLSGYLVPHAGCIRLMGRDITRLPPHDRCRLGLVRTFQINQLFPDFTVLESVAMAVSEHQGQGARWWKPLALHGRVLDAAALILENLGILDSAHETPRTLAYGRQRLVEIALALALCPKVLMLDEPAAGLSQGESRALFRHIAQLPADMTIVLVEHDMDLVFQFADSISVLASGALIAQGTPADIAQHSKVRQVYLGHP